MRATTAVALAGMILCCGTAARGQLRVAQWNITNWGHASVATRGEAFKAALYAVNPGNGLSMAPDILVVQEILQTGNAGPTSVGDFLALLNTATNSPGDWAAAPYVVNQGDTGNAIFYRTGKVDFVAGSTITLGVLGQDVGSGDTQAPRDNQRWSLRPSGYSSAAATMYFYGAHMKAGSDSSDQRRREPEGQRIRVNANALPIGSRFFLCGDFNVQSSGQTFYRYLTEFNAASGDFRNVQSGQFFDPINLSGTPSSPVSWENNGTYRNIHTQEPATQMDSRHDHILISAALRTGQGLSYIPAVPAGNILVPFRTYNASITDGSQWADNNHSFRCWGNDGESFQNPIRTTSNTEVGSAIASALITSVAGNGHLPVYMDVQVPARLGAPSGTIALGTVMQNAPTSAAIAISNAADIAKFCRGTDARGVDGLSYSLSISGAGFSLPGGPGPFERAATLPPAAANTHVVSIDTATPGTRTGMLTITSDDPEEPARTITITATVAASDQGGCCSTGLCSLTTLVGCGSGVYQGDGTLCTPNPCPQPTGACCGAAGACSVATQAACTSGYQGNLTTCAPNPCPQPTGACCTGTTCSIATATACAGVFQGADVTCGVPSNPIICCPANFNHYFGLSVQDIFEFLYAWFAGDLRCDFNHSGTLEVQDIFVFLDAWFAGCPG